MSAQRRLKKARKQRSQNAATFRALENGQFTVEDALRTPTDALKRIRIYDLLRRTPKLGDVGAKKVLMKAEVWPLERIGNIELSKRQKVIEALPDRCRRH